MKNLLPLSLLALAVMLSSSGCAWIKRHTPWHHQAATTSKTTPTTQATSTNQNQMIVTPDESLAAKVLKVNTVGRFVILNFPQGKMPKLDQHMFLYRAGLKTAEVKIVGPQQDTSIVADIISGDAQEGDTVRDQ
ncbi:MAG TPA: hypothetical protein VK811_08085 [Candidatus Acidoferrum sp.]|nr:hypothetical protein [Candidatus Acidoferrum sp.]